MRKTMNKDELKNELKKADQKAAKNWEKIKALKAEIETAKKAYYAAIDGKPFTEWEESAYLKNWSDKEEALDRLEKIAVTLSSNCRYFVEEIVKISLAEQLQKYAGKTAGEKTRKAFLDGINSNFEWGRVWCSFESYGEQGSYTLRLSVNCQSSYLYGPQLEGYRRANFIDENNKFTNESAAVNAKWGNRHVYINNPAAHVAKMAKLAQKYEQAKKALEEAAQAYNAETVFNEKRLSAFIRD